MATGSGNAWRSLLKCWASGSNRMNWRPPSSYFWLRCSYFCYKGNELRHLTGYDEDPLIFIVCIHIRLSLSYTVTCVLVRVPIVRTVDWNHRDVMSRPLPLPITVQFTGLVRIMRGWYAFILLPYHFHFYFIVRYAQLSNSKACCNAMKPLRKECIYLSISLGLCSSCSLFLKNVCKPAGVFSPVYQ